MDEDKMALKVFEIGLLGDTTIGKSSIIRSYLGFEFKDDILYTKFFEKYETIITLENNERIKLTFFDTAGQERFRALVLKRLEPMNGIILVADLTNKKSFDNIKIFLKIFKKIFIIHVLFYSGTKQI